MKTILISLLFLLTCHAKLFAGFTVDDWHHVGVNAPPGTDVPWEGDGFSSLIIDKDGYPIVAGGFPSLANQLVRAVAKWNGTNWQSYGTGLQFNWRYTVSSAVSDGTNLFVSGDFRPTGQDWTHQLAWWNGQTWQYDNDHLSAAPGFSPNGISKLVAGNGLIYAFGNFRLSGWHSLFNSADCIASWSPTQGWRNLGQVSWDTNVGGIPITEMVTNGNDLYVSGDLTHVGAVPANKIAKWDGLSWSALGSGFDVRPRSLVIHQGALIASGEFEQAGGGGIRNLARWDEHTWSEYAGGMPLNAQGLVRNYAESMTSDGQRLWVGGGFSYSGSNDINAVNYWNGSAWNRLPGGPPRGASDLMIFHNQLYCLDGAFTSKHVYRADLNALIVPFEAAASAAGLSGIDAQPNAIPFHDGVPNLLKYAFNLNLAGRDSRMMVPGGTAGLPHISRGSGDSPVFRVEYLRRISAGLNYLPQISTSLAAGNWEPILGTPQTTPIDASWQRVIHEIPATAERMFGRVGVELGP